ncbi:hypothetical protein BKA70DRAFT_1290795 [Coprinopsis sp. MPI-PUGE-AT-0042]|nr:hypothetical protein BKA70DRAFT_1290795 [Coprinopsis sp. MPI-PUGE-AT-0042]
MDDERWLMFDNRTATGTEHNLGERVVIKGVTLTLPLPGDAFFRRIVDRHIEPFPPLCDWDNPSSAPLLALCLPFTDDDQLRYANRRNLAPQSPIFHRRELALLHLRQNLPQKYTRWVTINDSIRAVVLATNETKSNLALAFNLDMLEQIRRLMGVRWIPTWNIPESDIQETIHKGRISIALSLVDWPADLPYAADMTWEDLDVLREDLWEDLWTMVEVRLEMHARVKGGTIPPYDVPMATAFQLDEP